MTAPTAAPRLFRTSPFERAWAIRVPLVWEVSFYAAVFVLAMGLRFWDLGSRALHHDESIHANWSWNLLDYHHSPVFHGPFYYHVQGLAFFLFGSSDYTSRVSAAAFGLGIVVLPLLLRRQLGAVGAGAAVAFIAFSPTLVYYSRFFREDIYMAFFVLLMAVAMWRYMEEGRDRWLAVFALAFTGAMTTKEGSFLVVASFLVYLDLYLAAQLATQTLETRGLNTTFRRFVLTGWFAMWAWVIAALWPFLGGLRRSMDWKPDLPRSGDVLILLGTFTLVLLTPVARPLLEPLGLLEKDRLNWEKNLRGEISYRDGMAIAGIFAMTISAAAFVGLQWKPRLWATLFGVCGFIYLTLMTSFWRNLEGLTSGPWGSLDYWLTQQDVSRGDQPWFYYDLLLPAYEFLPLIIAIGGVWWSLVRGDAFSRFLWVWLIGMWFGLSYGAEKMPWLNTHLALPACVLAGWTVGRAWRAWEPKPATNRAAISLAGAGAMAMGALSLIVFMPGGDFYNILRMAVGAVSVGLIVYAARPFGRQATAAFVAAAIVGALALFSVRTMVLVTFERGDVPKDMLIYTQSSPAIPDIMADIDNLAAASGKGHDLRIAVDSSDSFAWPWAWYLRDYKRVTFIDFTNGVPEGDFDVMLVNQSNIGRANDALGARTSLQFGTPRRYPHRWWFDEQYKNAMAVEGNIPCTHQGGNCGPLRLATWKHIFASIPGWLDTWYTYWRDHDADEIFGGANQDARCRSCGSVDAWAFFPANFDLERGMLSARPIEPPRPTFDAAGRAVFGGIGSLPGQFSQPVDIEADADGNLYVIDWATKKLQKFDANGNFVAAVGVREDPNNLDEAAEPWGIGIGPNGQVAVADTFGWRVRIFDRDLKFTGVAFGEAPSNTGDPGPYNLFGPRDVAFDPQGNIWVTDTGHARIQVYSPTGEYVRTIGSRGSGEGQFDEPVGLAFATDGTAFVADMYNSRVVMLDSSGTVRGQFEVDGWGGREVPNKPYLEPLRDGRVAIGLPGSNEVRIYGRDGTVSATIRVEDDPVKQPYGILETADAKLWIVEGGSGRIRQFAIP